MSRLSKILVMCAMPLVALLPACSFLEAAADVQVGSGTVPRATFLLTWPNVDQLIGDSLQKAGGADAPGLPTSLKAASLAHVQGLMTIDGECRRYFDQAVVDQATVAAGKDPVLKNLHVEVINCGTPGRCVAQCKDEFGDPFRGMRLWARVQFNLVNADVASKVGGALGNSQTDPDAIAAITLQFQKLAFLQDFVDPATGKTSSENIDSLFSGYELGVGSVYPPSEPTPETLDDTPIVTARYLTSISPTTPQRFEIDPTSAFSRKLRTSIVKGEQVWVTVYQRIDVPEANLYGVRLGTGGVDLDFQPEILLSGVKTIKGQL